MGSRGLRMAEPPNSAFKQSPPASIAAFFATWAAMLLLFGLQAVYSVATITEPDIKFGGSAPYIGLALFGGIGGFIAALSGLVATLVFEERLKASLKARRAAGVSGIAAFPFGLMVWHAAIWSPLPVFGTVAALFVACMAVFLVLLYVAQRLLGDASQETPSRSKAASTSSPASGRPLH